MAVNAYKTLVRSHDDMDLIHNPRNYTRHQNNLMTVLVGYVWNQEQVLVKEGANQLTEDITILERLAPKDISDLPLGCRRALRAYTAVKQGCLEDVRRQAKGYELLAQWIEAVHAYAVHTGQLEYQEENIDRGAALESL